MVSRWNKHRELSQAYLLYAMASGSVCVESFPYNLFVFLIQFIEEGKVASFFFGLNGVWTHELLCIQWKHPTGAESDSWRPSVWGRAKRTGAVHIRTFTVRAWRTDRFGPLSRRNYAREEQKLSRSPHRIKKVSCTPHVNRLRNQVVRRFDRQLSRLQNRADRAAPVPANNTASPCTHITFLLCCPWGLPLFLTIKFTRSLWSCKRSSQRTDHSVVLPR